MISILRSKLRLVLRILMLCIFLFSSYTQAGQHDERLTEGIDVQWLKTLISVEQTIDEKTVAPIGSAFLVHTPGDHFILVTAKHVVTDDFGNLKQSLVYRFNSKSGHSELITDSFMTENAGPWYFSKTHDVACRFILRRTDFDIKFISFDFFLSQEKVQPGAKVIIPGFPLGIRSEEYANPIVRHGVVSRSDGLNIIVDAFVFPGNSGGPVIYTPNRVGGVRGNSSFIESERIIGLVSSYIPYMEAAISQQTKRPRIIFEENTGLSNVVPGNAILDLLNREDIKKRDKLKDLK